MSDLAIPEIELADEDNALTYFREAEKLIDLRFPRGSKYTASDYTSGLNEDHEKTKSILHLSLIHI